MCEMDEWIQADIMLTASDKTMLFANKISTENWQFFRFARYLRQSIDHIFSFY